MRSLLSVLLVLSIVLLSSSSHAEIGRSISSFKNSRFARDNSFELEGSETLDELSEYEGKTSYEFKDSQTGRYSIEIIANPRDRRIVAQTLNFYSTSDTLAEADMEVVASFIHEAIGQSSVASIMTVVKRMSKQVAKKQYALEDFRGYSIEIVHHPFGVWETSVTK